MRYFTIDEKGLASLMRGLELIERLDAEKVSELRLHLYGMTSEQGVIYEAKAYLMDNLDEYMDEDGQTTLEEDDISLPEVAIAIPLSADTIYALTGSGIDMHRMEFAYLSGGGEGVKTGTFYNESAKRTRVTMGSLSRMALASDDIWLRDFLLERRTNQSMSIRKKERRTEPAIPVEGEEMPPEAPVGGEPTPRISSLGQLMEEFLDRKQ